MQGVRVAVRSFVQTGFLERGIDMEELTLGMMIHKVLHLQEFIKEKKEEHTEIQRDNDVMMFSKGVAAACTFFERALEDILGTKEDLEKLFSEKAE